MSAQSDGLLDAEEVAAEFRELVVGAIVDRLGVKLGRSFRDWADAGCPDDETWTPLLKALGDIPVMSQAEFERRR